MMRRERRTPGVIRVLVADDSVAVQEFLSEILDAEPDMLVVGTARDGEETVRLTQRLRPDLITMDANMPRLDGVAATREIMAECPTPIALVTAAPVGPGTELCFSAVDAGAVEAIAKPSRSDFDETPSLRDAFVRQLRNVAHVSVVGLRGGRTRAPVSAPKGGGGATALGPRGVDGPKGLLAQAPELIVIGASTGGPPVLRALLSGLDPLRTPPIALVQHMSEDFLPGFATWLDGLIDLKVTLAGNGARMEPGHVYVAAGNRHLVAAGGLLGLIHGAPVQFQRPSVDVLFESVARNYAGRAVGVLLTGMGRDGADGLLSMKQSGALTITQDESSCLVYGMPRVAEELGASRISTNPGHMLQILRNLSRVS